MAGLASTTERIQIGSLVACTGFRNPGLVAKMTETIDDISGGRFILGLGAGWHEPEFDAFGFPFDHRVSRFEEALAIIQPLLAGNTLTSRASSFRRATPSIDLVDRAPPARPSWSAPPAAVCFASSLATLMPGTRFGTGTPKRSCPRWPRLTRPAATSAGIRRR